jgi:hypothetical protein
MPRGHRAAVAVACMTAGLATAAALLPAPARASAAIRASAPAGSSTASAGISAMTDASAMGGIRAMGGARGTGRIRAAASAGASGAARRHPAAARSRAIIVTSRRSAGRGSLRAAIRRADARPPGRSSVIDFAVRGTITLASGLPVINRRVLIDATSAPGHVRGGPPVVELSCAGHAGLRFAAGARGSQLLGLAVDLARGNGVTIAAAAVTLDDDYIGLNLAGGRAGNRGSGVYLAPGSARDVIGLNSSGASGVVANVISANSGSGITLSRSSGDTIAANRIGTNPAGTRRAGNGDDGISVTSRSDHNEIGGTEFVDTATGKANNPTGSKGTVTPVFVVPPLGNLISGNRRNGVLIGSGSGHNVLNGNFIGTTADGDAALGNGGDGVWIQAADGNSLIGCKFVNNPFVYYNVVSGNRRNGLRITSSDDTTVQGNFFGTGANNTAIVANRLNGIRVDGVSANTQVGGVIPLGNVSAGNGRNGIELAGRSRNFVTFNTFGGLLAFKGAAPNGRNGLLVTATGSGNLARTNVFSGNDGNGIELAGRATGFTIDPDIVGLTTNGQSVLSNHGDGVLITGQAHGNIVGGSRRSVIPQNTFSGNLGYGLAITGRAHGNRVFGGFIGTAILGLAALGNRAGGVLLAGTANRNSIGQVRTRRSRRSNLISGNAGPGVTLRAGTRANLVINNYIGLDRIGRRLPNAGRAVINLGRGNVILGNRS